VNARSFDGRNLLRARVSVSRGPTYRPEPCLSSLRGECQASDACGEEKCALALLLLCRAQTPNHSTDRYESQVPKSASKGRNLKRSFFTSSRLSRPRSTASVLRRISGTCALAAGAASLSLVLAAFGVLISDDFEWNVDAYKSRLPSPGAFSSWVRPGSPMDCLLTSQESRLSVDFGHRYMPTSKVRDSSLDIVVGRTTTVSGDGLEALETYPSSAGFFRTAGLPREVGLRHYLDFIGASQRPEENVPCRRDAWWEHGWSVATLAFWCDGIPRGSLFFETSCPMPVRHFLHQPVYYLRAVGIIEVACGVVANRPAKNTGSSTSPTTARPQ
jgi:hypothetical protein